MKERPARESKNPTIKDIMASWPAHWPGESQQLDKDLLLMHTLKCDRAYLYTHRDQKLNLEQIKKIKSLFALREKGWPMAYILKEKEFYGLKFQVAPGVFIPRPETETLISATLSFLKSAKGEISPNFKKNVKHKASHQKHFTRLSSQKIHIMDFGCGTGCVGLSLLHHLPKAYLTGFDIEPKAIKVSQANAQNLGLSDRVVFIHQDVSHIVAGHGAGKTLRMKKMEKQPSKSQNPSPVFPLADIIVANPPYIAFKDPKVQKEVRLFEPPSALFAKEQGLACLKAWFQQADHLLKPNGAYFFEIGAKQDISFLNQHKCSNKISINNRMKKKAEFKDLLGYTRVIQFQKKLK